MDEEEEEIVISSWQQQSKLSDFPIKDSNESLLNTMKHRESKENFDMNPWLSEQDSKNRKLGQLKLKNEDDEIMLDDDTLSRLIEGDLKSECMGGMAIELMHNNINTGAVNLVTYLFKATCYQVHEGISSN